MFGIRKKNRPLPLTTPQFNQYDYQEKLAPYIEKVFIEQAQASYVGGSLCVNLYSIKSIIFSSSVKDEMICISVSDKEWNDEVRFFAGLCYIKYKAGNKEMVETSINNCLYNPRKAIDLIFKHLID